ncbi:ornithine cyclodeaminase family protein [Bradyrhizobium sp. RDM4]|uniref:ornithine cyclodeaminase family protein n=1 Tax=Bradyrhizobium sp. RDM4 TaxID=3378765 RepID=UPI0038FC405D
MTLLLRHEDVKNVISMDDAIRAMESAFQEEGAGQTLLPPRINMKSGKGWLRIGPVALEKSGVAGFKAMNLVPGIGLRYQVHLYSIETGAILAIMDAQHLTTLRTGATSVVATRRLARPGKTIVALLGSGVEARAQLAAMQTGGFVESARVFSPTQAKREQLAEDFSREHGMKIVAVSSAEEAVADAGIVVAAVKSSTPVLLGSWLKPGVHVNSVGTARRDQRELDVDVFSRAARIVVDTRSGVFEEAGDAYAARDSVTPEVVSELCELVVGKSQGRQNHQEITLFKSVGTGIQDIALAKEIYEKARAARAGTDLADFPYLKAN